MLLPELAQGEIIYPPLSPFVGQKACLRGRGGCTCVKIERFVLLAFFPLFYTIFRVKIGDFPLKRTVRSLHRDWPQIGPITQGKKAKRTNGSVFTRPQGGGYILDVGNVCESLGNFRRTSGLRDRPPTPKPPLPST